MPKALTANDLRWLGEEADGRRGENYALVWEDEKLIFVAPNDPRAARAILTVRTEYEIGPGMKADDARAVIKIGDEEIDPNAGNDDPVDAVFLTQASVEKFVIPYYTRMLELDQIEKIKTDLFTDQRVVAAAHIRPSIIDGVRRARLLPIGLKEDGRLEVLAPIELF